MTWKNLKDERPRLGSRVVVLVKHAITHEELVHVHYEGMLTRLYDDECDLLWCYLPGEEDE